MKKLYVIVLTLLLAMFCVACGDAGTKNPGNEDVETITMESDADGTEGSGETRSNVDGMNGSGAFDLDVPCENCGGTPSQMFTDYTEGMPEEPTFYCEPCTLTCFFCGLEATTHYNKGLWGEIFTCQECYEGVHGTAPTE